MLCGQEVVEKLTVTGEEEFVTTDDAVHTVNTAVSKLDNQMVIVKLKFCLFSYQKVLAA